ncbi:MAG: ankyrin repeat domain-containing protein, partial [Candidatus Dependentiae bacterium]|nr:ankyrin repeat domain-containing protein [Candidatus Dependentiae bacterium]
MKNRLSRILFTLSIITSYSTGMFGASNPPKPPVDIENKDGYTPLMLAVKKDKISDVRRLIKAKADVNHTSANGLTPLICAAQSGHINNVKILLQHKADPNASEFLGNTPLMYAIAHNQVPLCKVLVESKADRELKNKYGDTVLDLARKSGKSDQLLRYLFNPDEQKDTYSQGSNDRALTYIQQNNIKELSRLIAENNIDVNAEYTDKTTPLFVAVHMDKPIIAKMLLEAQADPNHQNTFGDTALMLAASTNNTDIVELLLTHNANPHILKKDGFTALLIAAQEGHIDTIEIFLKHGLNINNQENRFKASMLMMAAEHGHLPLVNYLTMNNADISLVDSAGNNAFTIAVGANNLLIAQELFNAGIKTNKTFDIFMGNNNGDNALTIAIQTKNTTMVAFLLDTIKKSDQAPFNYYINLNIKKALTKAVANNYVDATRILLAKNPIHQKDAQLLYSHAIKNNFTQIAQLLKTYLPDEPEVPAHVDQKATCSGPGCDKEGPQKCVQCATVSYCSKECQTAHWKTGGHKAVCLSLGGKTSVASKKHEQNSQTVLTQASKPKETEDSSHMALLLAAQQEKKAQQEAEKSEKSKKLVALLRDFNPENTIERAHLKRHIQDGYRLHGEDIKLYKTEYEKAESLLF